MAENLKNKSVLVIDNGMYVELARRLGRDGFGEVYYSTDEDNEYGKERDVLTGVGLDGIERIDANEIFEVAEEVDLIVFPDTGWWGMVNDFRRQGRKVWGGGKAEFLETSRYHLKKVLEHLKLPVGEYKHVIGADKIRKALKEKGEIYVKHNRRGDGETDHFKGEVLSERALMNFESKAGIGSKVMEFIIEDPIDCICEIGIDTYCVDGQFPENVMTGVEIKDAGYIGIIKPYKQLPETITQSLEALKPILKKEKYRQWLSHECRVTKDKTSYLTDFTARLPLPPGDIEMEIIKNLPEVMYYAAQGILKEPEYEGKYGMQIFISSHLASDDDVAIEIPKAQERWFKFRNLCEIEGTKYVVSHKSGMNEIGSIVAVGNDLEKMKDEIIERSKMIDAYGISINLETLDTALDTFNDAISNKII